MSNRFAAVPNEVFYAKENGEINLTMFLILCVLHKQADWSTGVVKFTCARTIAHKLGDEIALRTIQDGMNNLEKAGWLISGHVPGSKKNYPVTLTNYTALTGVLKGVVLNPCELRAYLDSMDAVRADDSGERGGDHRGDAATHHSIQNQQEYSESSTSSISPSLSLSSADTDTNPAEQTSVDYGTEFLAYLNKTLGSTDQTQLPAFIDSFRNCDDSACQFRFARMQNFLEWVLSQPRLAPKILCPKDFLFHWENKSGNEHGLRHQWERMFAASGADPKKVYQRMAHIKEVRREELAEQEEDAVVTTHTEEATA